MKSPDAERADPPRLVAELLRPEAYARPPEEVAFLQTHISWLFFAGDRVYKVKKPVDLGFLDFTSLDRRRHVCEEEVRLNRRLAPDVYLGVVAIRQGPDGHLRVGPDGPPQEEVAAEGGVAEDVVEWAVEMVRLPAHRMFARLLDRGEIDNEHVRALVSLLADFHARAATGPGVDEHGGIPAIEANTEQNFEQLRPFVGSTVSPADPALPVLTPLQWEFLRERTRSFLRTHRELLERRIHEHRIREGHGDLHAENVCFPESGVVAYDCIEFSAAFRCGDVAADLAFLTMDLDRRGYPGFAGYLLKHYAAVTGDAEVARLDGFYKGYRAIVRGKVAALTAADPDLRSERREELWRESMQYLQLAVAYELPPVLVVLRGRPAPVGRGLAASLARPLRAFVLHDDVRREARLDEATTDRTLLGEALGHLRSGHSVLVDAASSRRSDPATFLDAATRLDVPAVVVEASEEPGDANEGSGDHVLRLSKGPGAAEELGSRLLDRLIRRRAGDGPAPFPPPG